VTYIFSHEQFYFRTEVGQEIKYSSYFELYFMSVCFCYVRIKLQEFRAKSDVISGAFNDCVCYSVRYLILGPCTGCSLLLRFSVRRAFMGFLYTFLEF
jgi:hypothetical protein